VPLVVKPSVGLFYRHFKLLGQVAVDVPRLLSSEGVDHVVLVVNGVEVGDKAA
jgi:hypothetical protein